MRTLTTERAMDVNPLGELTLEYETLRDERAVHNDVYADLPPGDFRLLKILPGSDNTQIKCQLFQVAMHEQLEYTALSYAWGSRTANCSIELNGHKHHVRNNLWRFLHHARQLRAKNMEHLWIDALCINQSNMEERSSQVRLMPRIYTTARKVLIWLGSSYGDSKKAMKCFARPATYWQAKKTFVNVWGKAEGAAISGICARPYWKRLWIFQELMLARDMAIMCGGLVIPWQGFRDFLLTLSDVTGVSDCVRDITDYENVLASSAMSIVKQTVQPLDQVTLWQLMLATSRLRCSEPRDRVYALLGVATKGCTNVTADYSTPIPTLLNKVLRNQHLLSPPQDLDQVTEQCRQIAEMPGLDFGSLFSLQDQERHLATHPHADMAEFPLAHDRISLWWTSFYGHQEVGELLFRHRDSDSDGWLRDAAGSGKDTVVKTLLASDRSSLRSINYEEPLVRAASNGHKTLATLLADSAKADSKRIDYYPLLLVASRTANRTRMKILLEVARSESTGPDYPKILRVAIPNIKKTCLEILLEHARADSACVDYEMMVHQAMQFNRGSLVKILLDSAKADTGKINYEFLVDIFTQEDQNRAMSILHERIKRTRFRSVVNS